jgi:putative salt-induced outer membrane protein
MPVKPPTCSPFSVSLLSLLLMAGAARAAADEPPVADAVVPAADAAADTDGFDDTAEPVLDPVPESEAQPDAAAPEAAAEASPQSPAAPPPPPPSPWRGDVAIGVVNTSGNTRTRSVNTRGAIEYRHNRWRNRFSALAFSGSREGLTTDERYSAANKTDLQFNERNYAYTNLAYDNDRFAGIAERYAATIGYGRHLLTGPTHTLDIETGVGANRTRDQEDVYETAAIATFGGKYIWAISPNAEFSQTLRTEAGQTNVYVNPITALKLTIVGNLFATFNHEIRYNSQVPAATRHIDQISTLNLGYSFGTP